MDGKLSKQNRRSFIKIIAGMIGICSGILKVPNVYSSETISQVEMNPMRGDFLNFEIGDIFTIEGKKDDNGCLRQFVVTASSGIEYK